MTPTGRTPAWAVRRVPIEGTTDTAPVLFAVEDHPTRWWPGVRMHDLVDRAAALRAELPAIEFEHATFGHRELVEFSRALAEVLRRRGVGAGDRVLMLVDRSIWSHATVLALSRLGAAYVPVDVTFPDDRIAFIAEDSGVTQVLTLTRLAGRCRSVAATTIVLDELGPEVDAVLRSGDRFVPDEAGDPDPLAYVIYTSGSTGRPKGVAVHHSSICNFVAIASEQYGYVPGDRVYQGMTIAFDFSVEELWVPILAGATLVPAPTEVTLVGDDLHRFLLERRVTAMCCVPTLLATIPPNLPDLRLLLVSGEACPPDVIAPWFTDDRRVLNAYGPTEATVTATWSVMEPGRPVTIGGPLPTYAALILDPDSPRALEPGEAGELGIAGIAVAAGYLNRPEQTAKAFITDFVGIPGNHSGRIYRTGDLARINPGGEIEYLGRIDTQVKIRGYRIELDEIEVVARSAPSVGNAVVQPFSFPGAAGPELVAYVTPASPGGVVDLDDVVGRLSDALPRYMVPAFYEILPALPLLPSTKVDRSSLPTPTTRRYRSEPTAAVDVAATGLEARLSALLAQVMQSELPSVTAHFIDELGANSLTLAGFVAAIRRDLDLAPSVRLLYEHPTIRRLAGALDDAPNDAGRPPVERAIAALPPVLRLAPRRPSRAATIATGVGQMLYWVAFVLVGSLSSVAVLRYVDAAPTPLTMYPRAVLGGSALFFGGALLLLAVRWLAMPVHRTEPIPVYSLGYLRFWIARMAIQSNPANLLVGTPAYHVYLRALGVRVGRGALVLTRPPICPPLVRIGAGAVVRERSSMPAYRVTDGYVCPGTITVGESAVVAEATFLDIGSVVGARSQVGATSSVHRGQTVPNGSLAQGSPVAPTSVRADRVVRWKVERASTLRYGVLQLVSFAALILPIPMMFGWLFHRFGVDIEAALPFAEHTNRIVGAVALGLATTITGVVFAVGRASIVPRLIRPFLLVGEPLRVFSLQYHLARSTVRLSNNPVLHAVLGDSAAIVHYLRLLGYDMRSTTQTGSNFGMTLRHHIPGLCRFDRNTLVSDGLSLTNMEISATSFILRPIDVPPDTYIGNVVNLPGRNVLGPNCLIATKAAIPISGPVREGVGILGSPSFEIPRTVARDHEFDDLKTPDELRRRMAQKLRTNLFTIFAYLARSWILTSITAIFVLEAVPDLESDQGNLLTVGAALTGAILVSAIVGFGVLIGFERAARRNRPIEPRFCSLYDPAFWFHERYWKLNFSGFTRFFVGTPVRPVLFRLAGGKLGRGVFDDGAHLVEPSMLSIGEHTTLNAGAVLQCHSLEDGTFKSDRSTIGSECTINSNAYVHYGVHLHDRSTVEPDSFVMKGTVASTGTRWVGNPAQEAPGPVSRPGREQHDREHVGV